MSTAVDTEARVIAEPAEAYHQRTEISKGMLADFHQRRRLFEGRYISRTIAPKKSTRQMEIGTLVHAAILEPDRIGDLYAVIPEELLASNGAASTKAAKEFIAAAQAAGQHPVKADEWEMIQAMAKNVQSAIGPWLGRVALAERTIVWRNEATGLMCRCKPDWIRPSNRNTILAFDIKTTGDISEHGFRNSAESFAYWLQDAHYSEGIEAATGRKVEEFIFVAVESDPPYQCRPYQLDDEDRAAAVAARNELMMNLAECMKTGDFSEAWEGIVTRLSIRSFAFEQGR